MLIVIGETLPLAIAIAFSPLGIVSVIVMLLSRYPRASSASFVVGWASGITAVALAGYALAALFPDGDEDAPRRIAAPLTLIVLGVISIALAVRQWRARPAPDEEVDLPAWMSRIDGLTAVRSFAFGVVLAATKPKNIILAFGAGVAAAAAGLDGAKALVVLAVFLAFASISMGAPVIAYLIAGDRIRGPLLALREWLVRHNSAMLGLILLFLGVVLVGNGIAAL